MDGRVLGDFVDGMPARIWTFASPSADSTRRSLTVSASLHDRVRVSSRVTLDLGLRVEVVDGSAAGALQGVTWTSILPRASAEWNAGGAWRPTMFGGYRRTAHRLPLNLLAVGDPHAPLGAVFRWDPPGLTAPDGSPGPLVARVGPGTGGNSTFSAIDGHLKRPRGEEVVLGTDLWPGPQVRLRIAGLARREADLIDLVDIGVPPSSYSRFDVADPGLDIIGPADDQWLPIFSRRAGHEHDRFLLTNRPQQRPSFRGLEISASLATRRLTLAGGATAGIALARAGSPGFGPLENDQGVASDLFTTLNADTFARGRPFSDRAYTVKLLSVLRLPNDVRLGAVARYQDGQPFARLVVASGLEQGAEAVRAVRNGDHRFTFTGTLDARLTKSIAGFEVLLDVYNLLGLSHEVEERVVTGEAFRAVTAVQPPRAVIIGFRWTT
jgi:hypothetical protein